MDILAISSNTIHKLRQGLLGLAFLFFLNNTATSLTLQRIDNENRTVGLSLCLTVRKPKKH